MPHHELLNNVTHKNIRIITEHSARFGDNRACTSVFPFEFRQLQSEYPIVFRKVSAPAQFEPVALLGLADGENLYLDDDGWNARYIPLSIQRQPFLIGFQETTVNGVPTEEPVVHIDMESPRVNEHKGEVVFLPHGGNSQYLERINSILQAIHQGHLYNQTFCKALAEFQLLEPLILEVKLADQRTRKVGGFYTVHEENLQRLTGEAIGLLHKRGYLEHIYRVTASLENVRTLIDKKNQLLVPRAAAVSNG